MRQAASLTNWDSRNPEDEDVSWELIHYRIQQVVLEFSPPHRHQTHAMGPPWFDRELRAASGSGIKPGPGTVRQAQDMRNIDVFEIIALH
ncbi:unnamed protein product [Echinostoma caproni]|uniref:Uncharacterized protein n=1 Tax=Echinostoma caproni TaxID=27848 RepID=A0A183AQ87_9TREM|nr:unnamed protein product [Echinostoma caproni]